MIATAFRCMQSVLKKRFDIYYNAHRSAFIVLLPEVDPELADKLMSVNEELPEFSKITKEKIGTVIGKHIVDLECTVRNMDRKLEESPKLYSDLFEDVLNPLEKTIHSFDTVYGIFNTLYLVDKNVVPPAAFYTVSTRAFNSTTVLFNAEHIYKACKKADKEKMTEDQARYVDKILFEGRLNGLDGNARVRGLTEYYTGKIVESGIVFQLRADAAKAQFYVTINDPLLVVETPRYLLRKMSHMGGESVDGPWTLKLHYGVAETYMDYCPDREMRFMIWHGEDKAGSIHEVSRELANSVTLEDIRMYRHQQALILGFKNYFDMKFDSKMIDDFSYLMEILKMYAEIARRVQYEEVCQLQSFADAHGCITPIQLWDVGFWGRKFKKFHFNFDNELLRNYLPLARVVNGLFDLCSRLFGIRIEEVKTFDSWHPDVRFFYIYEPDCEKPVAGFYFDPFLRETKFTATSNMVTCSVIRNSSRVSRPVLPLVAFVGLFQPPDAKHPCVLSFSEAKELFGIFGHGLQYLLNKSSYVNVAGGNFIEFDAFNTCLYFLADWVYDEATFRSISAHYETGEPAPPIDLEGVRKHLAGYNLSKQLFKSRLDIDMHTKNDIFWEELGKALWDEHYVFPMSKFFSDPCRYVDIFKDEWGAAYYSVVWSQMLAADIRLAFYEEKDDASVGARFKDTYLTFGGACHSKEVFRRFRGRDPQPVSLIKYLGLSGCENEITDDDDPKEDPKYVLNC